MKKILLDWIHRNTKSNTIWNNFDDLHISGTKQGWLNNVIINFNEIFDKSENELYRSIFIRS